jgi:ABC-type bacteriocin/lantibiotic exporter with double-glycine peptidase domain
MIQVTENEDHTFTISWDETSPTESILNTWTEADFIKVIMERLEELKNNERQDQTHSCPNTD